MTGHSPDLLAAMAGRTALVVGDCVLDGWLRGGAARLSREAPVPVVDVTSATMAAGGAANAAVNAAGLGARVRLVSVTGADCDGALLRAALREAGVPDTDVLSDPGRRTPAKRRVSAAGQMVVRLDEGEAGPLGTVTAGRLASRLTALVGSAELLLVSDYGLGVCDPEQLAAVVQSVADRPTASRRAPLLVVDARNPVRWRDLHPDVVKPNWAEAAPLLGVPAEPGGDRAALVEARAERVLAATGARIAAVTLDVDGAVVLERGRPPYRVYATPAPAAAAAGAGDAFVVTFALALAAGADAPAAAELAAAAAAVCVSRPGTTACTADDLRAALLAGPGLLELADLPALVHAHRRRGERLVFTNGCFDVLHPGHLSHLNRAKALGDVLVVGLNSDASVRRLKGPDRPVQPLADRAELLAALSCVDHVVAFEGDTPADVLEVVRPEIYVKGSDHTRESLPETPLVESLGGQVVILPLVADRSTGAVRDRIRAGER